MDTSVTGPAPSGAGDLFGILRRRWILLLAGLLIGIALTAAYVTIRPPMYTSTASVLVTATGVNDSPAAANGQRLQTEVNLDTEAQLVESNTVITQAKALLKTDQSAEALARAVQVEVPQNTSVLAISFDGDTARNAQRGAQAFATAYLAVRRAGAQQILNGQIKAVQAQITEVRKQLQTTTGKIAATPSNSPDRQYSQAQASVLTTQLSSLSDRLSTLQSTSANPGQIIADAARPKSASGLPLPLLLGAGAAAGLLLGLALAVLRERTDHRLHTAADIERRLGTPVLLDLARMRQRDLDLSYSRSGRAGQEFRRLRNTLAATLPAGKRVILVTSASPSASAGLVAANLAGALARSGSSAILLCADPNSRTGAQLLGTDTGPGLTATLSGAEPVQAVLRPHPATDSLRIAPQGEYAHLLSERLQTEAARELIAIVRTLADFVVIELAPTATSADAQTVARWADAAVVVVEGGRTEFRDVRDAVQQLESVGLSQVAAALLPAPRRRQGGTERPSQAAPSRPTGRVAAPARDDAAAEMHASEATAIIPVVTDRARPGKESRRAYTDDEKTMTIRPIKDEGGEPQRRSRPPEPRTAAKDVPDWASATPNDGPGR